MNPVKTPVAVFISGRGSNMEKLIEAAGGEHYPARICGVLSDKTEAAGLMFAAAHGIPTAAIERKDYADKVAHEAAIQKQLVLWGTEFIALAGFMRILSPEFVSNWQRRLINIHPSLLPKYKGLHTHARALKAGDKVHGCSVHWVTPELDSGDVIAHAKVPVLAGDTQESLAARVLVEEHRLFAKALAQILKA